MRLLILSKSPTDVAAPPASPRTSLAHKTARGFAWLTLEALSNKAVNFIAQILLARLLLPEHFGMIGLTFTVTTFADLASNAGLKEVLIQRAGRFERWVNAGIWMSLALGLTAGAVVALAAPWVALAYDSPTLTGMLLIMGISMPLSALTIVPEAKIRSQMRFRALGLVGVIRNAGMAVLSVFLAWQGFEAYSFVWPRVIVFAIVALLLWWLAFVAVNPHQWLGRLARRSRRSASLSEQLAANETLAATSMTGDLLSAPAEMASWPLRWNPQFRRWLLLLPDTLTVFMSTLLLTVIAQSGYIVLGLWHSESVVGRYFFAYNLSLQAAILIGLNFAGVMFPALSSLQHDPQRQLSGFLRAGRVLAMLGVPASLLQAAIAEPAVLVLFGQQWVAAISTLQILSIGMAAQVMWNSNRGLYQAQGRFAVYLRLIAVYAVVYLAATIMAARLGQEGAVAVATAGFYLLITPVDTYLVIRSTGGRWRDVWNIYALPTALSIIAIVPITLMLELLPNTPMYLWIRLLVIPAVSFIIYAAAARRASPATWSDLMQRVTALIGRRRQSINT